jgi:hypothetical protein
MDLGVEAKGSPISSDSDRRFAENGAVSRAFAVFLRFVQTK